MQTELKQKMTRFKEACWDAVLDDIYEFKSSFFKHVPFPVCEVTGELLAWDNSHVDHVSPVTFDNIVYEFIKEKKINIDQIDIDHRSFSEEFREWHNKVCKLRIISGHANPRG
ncbi:MAG: hypothetical protein SVK08_00400 [Halobacteriota archaeon]|nr:hypothetical protein [Halobacteriota archaeon]